MSISSYNVVSSIAQVLAGLAVATFLAAQLATIYQGFRRSVPIGLAVLLLSPVSIGVYLYMFRKEHPRILRTLLVFLMLCLVASVPGFMAWSMRSQGGSTEDLLALVRSMAPLRQGLADHVKTTGRWPDKGELAQLPGAAGLGGAQRRFSSNEDRAWVILSTEDYSGAPSIEFAGLIDPASRTIIWRCHRDKPERSIEVCTAWDAGIRTHH